MNKTEFIEAVRANTDRTQTKADIEDIVNTALRVIMDEVKKGGSVQFVGFGTFEATERSERCGRNPQTGAEMVIAATKVPKFKPGKAFKDMVKA